MDYMGIVLKTSVTIVNHILFGNNGGDSRNIRMKSGNLKYG